MKLINKKIARLVPIFLYTLILISGVTLLADTFEDAVFDIVTTKITSINTEASAQSFVAKLEQALEPLKNSSFKPQKFDMDDFTDALASALGVGSTHPLAKADVKARINSVKSLVDAYNSGQNPFAGTQVEEIPQFVIIKDFVDSKYREFKRTSTITSAAAESLAKGLLAVVNREAPGIVDDTVMSLIRSNLTGLRRDLSTKGADKAASLKILDQAITFLANISMAARLDFLDRIWVPEDAVFSAGAGEQRFLAVASFVDQKFETLSAEEKEDFQGFLTEAVNRKDFSSTSKSSINALINKRRSVGSGNPLPIVVAPNYVDLKKYLLEKNNDLLSRSRTGGSPFSAEEAARFTQDFVDVVKREVAGFTDMRDLSMVNLNIDSIINNANKMRYKETASSTLVDSFSSADRKALAAARDFVKNITLSDRLDFLIRVTDSADPVFSGAEGETRFLSLIDFVVQKFSLLSADDKNDLLAIIASGKQRNDFSDRTKKSLASTMDAPMWNDMSAGSSSGSNTGTPNTPLADWQKLSPADIRGLIQNARVELSAKLVRLVADEYDVFLGDLESMITKYRYLVQQGEVKLEVPSGGTPDSLIAEVTNFVDAVAKNYRFAKDPNKTKVTALYNLAVNKLSLDQKIDDYSRRQAAINNDNDAIKFVQRLKDEFLFNADGSLKDSFKAMSDADKDTLKNYLKDLRDVTIFGAADESIASLLTTLTTGLGVEQLITALSDRLAKVNDISTMNSFMVALRDLKVKFDALRAKGNVTDAQRASFIGLIASTQDANRFWRLKQGSIKTELDSMRDSLKNSLPIAALISSLKAAHLQMKENPDSINPDDIENVYNRVKDLVDEWQFSRIIQSAEVANNSELLGLIDSLNKNPDFSQYQSNFASMTDRLKKAIPQDAKILSLFGYLDNVLKQEEPAPKAIENFVKAVEICGTTELARLTTEQKDSLRAKIDATKNKTYFDAAQKKRLTDADQKIAAVATIQPTAPAAPVTRDLTGDQTAGATTPPAAGPAPKPRVADLPQPAAGVVATQGTATELALNSQRTVVKPRQTSTTRTPNATDAAAPTQSSAVLIQRYQQRR